MGYEYNLLLTHTLLVSDLRLNRSEIKHSRDKDVGRVLVMFLASAIQSARGDNGTHLGANKSVTFITVLWTKKSRHYA
jgi:hypothetical protein